MHIVLDFVILTNDCHFDFFKCRCFKSFDILSVEFSVTHVKIISHFSSLENIHHYLPL